MTHASVPPDQRAVLGISDNFVRLSVGLEDADDLVKDLDQAMQKAVGNFAPFCHCVFVTSPFVYNMLGFDCRGND